MNVSNSKPIQQATPIQSQKVQQGIQEEHAVVQSADESKKKEDEVTLSDKALEMQKLLRQVQATPDVRADKVAEIKKALDNGTYTVSPADIAKKILRNIPESE